MSYQSSGDQQWFTECITSQVGISSGPRVSYQSSGDQKWSPECLTSQVGISSGPQTDFPRVTYQLGGDQ